MKRQPKQWMSVFLALSFLFLCVIGIGTATVSAEAAVEDQAVTAFQLKKSTASPFPLFKGEVGFRFLSGFKKAIRTGKNAAAVVKKPDKIEETVKEKTTPHLKELGLGGNTFGVKLAAEGVLVVSVNENEAVHPAYDAGIRAADRIIQMNDTPIRKVEDVGKVLDECGGNVIKVVCLREGKTKEFSLTPLYEAQNGKYKAGIWIRDSVSGIGTMTYFSPTTGEFGGLGHGICDGESGRLVPIRGGTVLDVSITEIIKGEVGKPGELRGFLKPSKKGALVKNNECGVFGVLSPIPTDSPTVAVASKEEINEGKAYLRSALDSDTPKEYEIKISNIHTDAKNAKCFEVTVIDPELLAKTGGIVQGMSGSPILQDGKLIGAVTHVLVGDPTRGYGIFIENMLAAGH